MEVNRHNSDHYNHEEYLRTIDIERGCVMGVDAQEVYDRETDFALRVANVKLGKDDKILDMASGAGRHIARMNKRLGGEVQIDGIEKAETLAMIANEQTLGHMQSAVRNRIVHIGDMADIQNALPEKGIRYKLVTCLGSSFIYLNKAQREKTLRDTYDVLVPGGKVVFQWRQGDQNLRKEKEGEIEQKRGNRFAIHMTKRGEREVGLLLDNEKGDGFYHYNADTTHPDSTHPDDYESYRNTNTGCIEYKEKKTGVVYTTFGRTYIPNINDKIEIDLGTTTVNEFISTPYNKALITDLERVGFGNIQFHENAEPIGFHKLYAIMATKPFDERDGMRITDEDTYHSIQFWENR